jgi:uncharacterized membrane protein
MKFFAAITTFAAALASSGAGALATPAAEPQSSGGNAKTFVALQNSRTCSDAAFGFSKCGNSRVRASGLRWADVTVRGGQTATLWARSDCTGSQRVVVSGNTKCRALGFDVRCVSIRC